jgi:hypothetical protein
MEQQYKTEMKSFLDKKINLHSFENKKVFLFGHCNATEEMADYLLLRFILPVAILDNSVSKQGSTYRGIPIISPEIICKYNSKNSVILIASRFFAQMFEQCRRIGYNGEILQIVEYNSFSEYSLSEETIMRKTERMLRGKVTLDKIRYDYPTHHLVICPNNALGDVYWAMSFLPSYCAKNKIFETVIIVIGDTCCKVAEMFGRNNIITLDKKQMDELVQAVIFTNEKNSIISHHDRPYTDSIIKWLNKHFLSFVDYYRYAVYGLASEVEPISPHLFSLFENKENIPKGKTVIISPYANSVAELPSEFWDKIVTEYTQKGYAVYTNVVGDEKPLAATNPIKIPIVQMPSAVEYAGIFIGMRSGLCDIVHTSNCKKIVVFPDCCYSTTPWKVANFFKLPGWESIIV